MAKFYKYQHNGPYQNGDLPQGDDDDELRDDGEDSGLDHEDNANETNAKINKGRFCWRRGGGLLLLLLLYFCDCKKRNFFNIMIVHPLGVMF